MTRVTKSVTRFQLWFKVSSKMIFRRARLKIGFTENILTISDDKDISDDNNGLAITIILTMDA